MAYSCSLNPSVAGTNKDDFFLWFLQMTYCYEIFAPKLLLLAQLFSSNRDVWFFYVLNLVSTNVQVIKMQLNIIYLHWLNDRILNNIAMTKCDVIHQQMAVLGVRGFLHSNGSEYNFTMEPDVEVASVL